MITGASNRFVPEAPVFYLFASHGGHGTQALPAMAIQCAAQVTTRAGPVSLAVVEFYGAALSGTAPVGARRMTSASECGPSRQVKPA